MILQIELLERGNEIGRRENTNQTPAWQDRAEDIRPTAALAGAPEVRRRGTAKQEVENDAEDHGMHHQLHDGVKRADHDVKRHPGDEQPTRPVATGKHEDAGDDRGDTQEVDHPMPVELSDSLCESYTAERQHTAEKRYAAEHYEKPTDDRDGSGTLFHGTGLQPGSSPPLVQHCAAAKREGREPGAAQQQ